MPFELESTWCQPSQVGEAALDFVDPITGVTAEVVVVPFACDLVALWFARELNRHEPALGQKGFERAVNGGNPQTWSVGLGSLENLLGSQRSVRFFEHLPNSLALACIAIHGTPSVENLLI